MKLFNKLFKKVKIINAVYEKTDTGYSIYSEDILGCVAMGEDLEKAKASFIEACFFHTEYSDDLKRDEYLDEKRSFIFKDEETAYLEKLPRVTLAWDGYPTIQINGDSVFPRSMEMIINKQYYKDGDYKNNWPTDPKTGLKLLMAERRKI